MNTYSIRENKKKNKIIFYQLRTKIGNGDVYYFVECEASSLEEIYHHIQGYDLVAIDYNIVRVEQIETLL